MDYKLIKDGHIVPSYSIETALSKIFETIILKRGEEEGDSHKIDKLKELILGSKWNVERMLAEYFQGFYQGNENKQKIYAYLSWLLWFYFRVKQITAANNSNMFYDSVAKTSVEDSRVYTFNYTKLAELSGLKNVTHVHGDLDRYYNYATRVGAKLPNPKGTTEEEVENLTDMIQKLLSFDKNLINLPTLVPPLPFKPMLSLESIKSYYSFYEHMVNGDSDKCIVVGFSYSDTDTHLNMLFRHFGGTTFHLNPDADTPKKISSLKGINIESVMPTYVVDIPATQVGQKDIFICLKAEEVTPELLQHIAEN